MFYIIWLYILLHSSILKWQLFGRTESIKFYIRTGWRYHLITQNLYLMYAKILTQKHLPEIWFFLGTPYNDLGHKNPPKSLKIQIVLFRCVIYQKFRLESLTNSYIISFEIFLKLTKLWPKHCILQGFLALTQSIFKIF